MKFTNALFIAAVAASGYHFWHQHRAASAGADDAPSSGNFVSVEMPDGAERNKVLILAPLNCPSSAAKRADALSARLTQMGIPNERGDSYHLHVNAMSAEEQLRLKNTKNVLGGNIPAVFVNGMGKGNPSADEVAEVFHNTQ